MHRSLATFTPSEVRYMTNFSSSKVELTGSFAMSFKNATGCQKPAKTCQSDSLNEQFRGSVGGFLELSVGKNIDMLAS